jgi:hypothetical protein
VTDAALFLAQAALSVPGPTTRIGMTANEGSAHDEGSVGHLSTEKDVKVEYRSLEEARAELRAGRALVLIEPGKPGVDHGGGLTAPLAFSDTTRAHAPCMSR